MEYHISTSEFVIFRIIASYGAVYSIEQPQQTEDTGYYYTTDHNFTTPWDFARDEPPATHIVIHIGYYIIYALSINIK